MPKKLIMNNFFNALGKESSRYGNAFAGAGLLYYVMGSTLNLLFEDELAEVSNLQKNILCGALTGGIYKSLKGPVGFGVGSAVGAAIMLAMTKLS